MIWWRTLWTISSTFNSLCSSLMCIINSTKEEFLFVNIMRSVQRVITRKIPTTGNSKTYISSMDNDVVSVLLAKQLVLQARKSDEVEKVIKDLYHVHIVLITAIEIVT